MCARGSKLGRRVCPKGARMRRVRASVSVTSFPVKIARSVRLRALIGPVTLLWEPEVSLIFPIMCASATKLGRRVCPDGSRMIRVRVSVSVTSFPVKMARSVRYRALIGPVTR
ncbi:hypothetical protein DPMN_186612 [Dreissena polymorpha]|uniref:Uncharacterized protein n=1 Tax=Dreissena polymorpha TaxID=45954 RepID=A0A9D4I8B5_DREPO|nr:hypothetical protein DPMN_186612 [Dreissena polymorpha]